MGNHTYTPTAAHLLQNHYAIYATLVMCNVFFFIICDCMTNNMLSFPGRTQI